MEENNVSTNLIISLSKLKNKKLMKCLGLSYMEGLEMVGVNCFTVKSNDIAYTLVLAFHYLK